MFRICLAFTVAAARIAHADIYSQDPDPEHATVVAVEGTAASLAITGAGAILVLGNHGQGYGESAHFIGTLALGLGSASLIITPSLGHDYGTGYMGTPGMMIRIGGYAGIVGGAILEVADNLHDLFCFEDSCPGPNHRGLTVMGVGAATMLVGAVYDIATAHSATEAFIRRRHADLHLAPTALRGSDGRTVAGLGLGGRF